MERVTGGCLCGAVRFVAVGRPFRVGICHCMDCRKHHGAPFHASAIFPESAVTISGEVGDYRGRCFCPNCGSSVFSRSGDEVDINLGSGCTGSVRADLRTLDHPPRSLAAALSIEPAL